MLTKEKDTAATAKKGGEYRPHPILDIFSL